MLRDASHSVGSFTAVHFMTCGITPSPAPFLYPDIGVLPHRNCAQGWLSHTAFAQHMGNTMTLLYLYLLIVSAITFAFYGYDKAQARSHRARVPEWLLLGLGAIGGSIGGFLGQRYFRHKTKKTAFLIPFWLIVVGQLYLIFAAPAPVQQKILSIILKIMN